MMKKLFFLFFFILLSSSACAETSLKAEVDKTTVNTAEQLTYKLTINSSEKNLPVPKFPSFKGFAVISQAQSSTVLFGNNDVKTILVYVYILTPNQAGILKIEPGYITIKGKTYSSEEVEVKCIQDQPSNKQPQESKPPLSESLDQGTPGITL